MPVTLASPIHLMVINITVDIAFKGYHYTTTDIKIFAVPRHNISADKCMVPVYIGTLIIIICYPKPISADFYNYFFNVIVQFD